jgi:mono/diheme cytochrome c family protein
MLTPLLALCIASFSSAPEDPPHGEAPTWARDIAPLVYRSCAACHRPGEVGPFPLLSYDEVKKRAKTIVRVTESRHMPPWHPVEGHGEFAGSLRLKPEEIALFKAWLDADCPSGELASAPPVPEFAAGWQLGEPDLVVEMPRAFEVPAGGPDIYRNFAIPLGLDEERWITAIEVRPQSRAVLHHVLFDFDASGRARSLDGQDGKPGWSGAGGEGAMADTAGLGGWAVGGQPRHLPMGLARKLPKGADLVLRSHFHPSGKVEEERTKLGLYFAKEPPELEMLGLQLPPAFGIAAGLDVPAGEKRFVLRDAFVLPTEALAVEIGGHAHMICREMQMWVTPPGGERRSIFWIDDWDFDWQNRYAYAQPLKLAAGTKIEAEIVYDNSSENPSNPFDPPQRIRWGLQSTDEMGSISLLLVPLNGADARALQRAIRAHGREQLAKGGESVRSSVLSRLKMLDQDGDGAIAEDELPERFRRQASRLDTNGDGKIDFQELEAAEAFLGGARRGRGEGGEARRALEAPQPKKKGPLLEDLDGREQAPLDVREAKAHVLVFALPDCPIANAYAPELQALQRDYAERGVRFFLVHVDPDTTKERAAEHARSFGVPFPVLRDTKHELVRATGATITPEAAVILPSGELAYRGRIDDLFRAIGKKREQPTQRELRAALDAVLSGQAPAVTRTIAVGCDIPPAAGEKRG